MTTAKDEALSSGGAVEAFHPRVLDLDCAEALRRTDSSIREIVARQLRRRGVVVAVSGGVDSCVCAALAVRALGPQRVLALLMPERDSAPESTAKGRSLCEHLGVEYIIEDIAGILDALGCYRRRDEAIREVFPQFGPGCRQKIAVADNLLDEDRVNYFNLVVETPDGVQHKKRMPLEAYLKVVAATNMKQRTRKLLEYFHAEARNYAVIGTPNRLEYDQGFFVRGGDGLADLKPIAHLYKTQVYALARHVGLPEEICNQIPSTDTYSLPQTQEEFYFALPYEQMDLLLYAFGHKVDPRQAAAALGLTERQVERVYRDIVSKRRTTRQLHQPAILMEEVDLGLDG